MPRRGFLANPTGWQGIGDLCESVGKSGTVDEEKFTKFTCNVRSGLSDLSKCTRGNGMYVSTMTSVSLKEYVTYRTEFCARFHKTNCMDCPALTNLASEILRKGIVKVAEVFKMQFSSSKYQSDKAVRRLMQLPVVIFKRENLFVTELRSDVNYDKMVDWIEKIVPQNDVERKLNKETLKSLCELASTESDRRIIKAAATWGMSAKEAKKTYGVDEQNSKTKQIQEAMALAEEINESTMALAMLQDTALLQSMGIVDDTSSDSDSCESEVEDLESFSEDDERSSTDCENEAVYALPKDTENKDTHKRPPKAEDFPIPIRFDPDFCSKDVALASPRPSNETLLSWLRDNKLSWFSFYNDLEQYLKLYSTQVLNQVLLDFADYLSNSDLTEEEERIIEISRQAFLEYMKKQPLMIEGEEVVSETENEYQGPETIASQPLLSEERKQEIQVARRAIRQRAKRIATKDRASQSVLKRRIPKRVSKVIQQHPTIGKDIEEFVKSKRVGADAWRRTGVLTFDGARVRGKKVTYRSKNTFKPNMIARLAMELLSNCA